MHIKWKAIAAVMLLNFCICTIFLFSFLNYIGKDKEEYIQLHSRSATSLAEFIHSNNSRRFKDRIKNFVNYRLSIGREHMILAFKNKDRETLLKYSMPFMDVFRNESPYFASMAWILPDNTVFLRVHKPNFYGDNVSNMRLDIAEVNRTHKPVAGYAIGHIGVQFRVVQPVFYMDEYIGALQFGIDAQEILDALKDELGTYTGLAIPDTYFKYITRPSLSDLNFGPCAIQSKNLDIFGAAGVAICDSSEEIRIQWRDKHFIMKKILGLKDFRGKDISHVIVALDISTLHIAESRTITWAVVLTFGVLLLSFIILNLSFGKILNEIVRLNQSLTREKEKLARRVKERTAELAEKVSEYELVAHAVENSIDAFVFTGLDGRITYPNRACCQLLGYEASELLGRHVKLLVAEEHDLIMQKIIIEQLKWHERWDGNITCVKKNGKKVKCLLSASMIHDSKGKTIGILGILRDLSNIRQIEEEKAAVEAQLQQATKLESIGRLAGGVAHDFNNILNVINGYAELGLLDTPPGHPLHDRLKGILEAGKRAAGLTQQLLAFSRKQIIKREAVDFNSLVRDVESMIRRIIGEDIDISVKTEPGLWHIMADRSQLEQIIINLAVNARDAMPAGGKLTIEASNITVDSNYSRLHYNIPTGKYVAIEVSDTGEGMPAHVRDRVFEPFFTTKELGKGTGLGLSTVYGIVKQNSGAIMVYSEEGHGTTFKFLLPAAEGPDSTETVIETAEEAPTKGSGTILLVEDDEAVRTLSSTVLTNLGYTVIEADSPGTAIELFQARQDEIDLLLSDVVMPRMNGPELAERLKEKRPDLKVLFMSGYTENVIVDKGILKDGVNLLHKPFTLKSVAEAVRKTMSDR